MKLPIFNLTWTFDRQGKFGLVYTSELKNDSQDFSFFVPIPVQHIEDRRRFHDWEYELMKQNFYFPFELRGEYRELPGEFNPEGTVLKSAVRFEQLSLSFSVLHYKALFQIDIYALRSFYRTRGIPTRNLHRYIGRYKNHLMDNTLFVPLIPLSLSSMNEVCLKHQGVFVGHIPEYGELKQYSNFEEL